MDEGHCVGMTNSISFFFWRKEKGIFKLNCTRTTISVSSSATLIRSRLWKLWCSSCSGWIRWDCKSQISKSNQKSNLTNGTNIWFSRIHFNKVSLDGILQKGSSFKYSSLKNRSIKVRDIVCFSQTTSNTWAYFLFILKTT